ncbi:MAG: Binding-protein-dependent transport system inner rane component [Chthoniobacteraceae bacterium]|nr:Binding-protein-dependent transport system inner rane component [Chthoniobacteraceae bacterium]
MFAFILRRFLGFIVVLWCVITLTFFLARLAPGSPFSRERKVPAFVEKQLLEHYKLSGTLWEQYTAYLGDLLHGDLRVSFKYRDRSVNELIGDGLPVSAVLGLSAFILATTLGVWLGSLAALRQHTLIDTGSMLGAMALISVPTFVTGPVLVLVFGLWLRWLPVGGWNSSKSLILPAITLAGPYIAYIARLMRSSMLEVLSQDFIRTARAKGLTDSAVVARHALKVAILPIVSFLGPLAANLLTGSIVVETIFNIPGMGGYFVNAILNRDVFLLCGVVIVYCVILVGLNFVVDVAYTALDRRIKLYE